LVPHNQSFFKKISFGLAVLEGMVVQINGHAGPKGAENKATAERPGSVHAMPASKRPRRKAMA